MKTVLITKSCYCSLDNSTLFKLEFLSENEKLIDARLCEISTIDYPNNNYFIGITDKNRLFFSDSTNGKLLYSVDLPKLCKFSSLGWSREGEIAYVKGKKQNSTNISPSNGRRGSRVPSNAVFCFFNIVPLQYCHTISIEETIFGPISNVYVAQQCLMIVNTNNLMKFYSLEHIEQMNKFDNLKTPENSLPASISIDFIIESRPPCLYEVKTANDAVEMGGHPWRCLYRPPHKDEFVIENVHTKTLIDAPKDLLKQREPGCGIEVNVFFHPDETGKILVVSGSTITCYLIVESNENFSFSRYWSTEIFTPNSAAGFPTVAYTSSGRRVNNKNWFGQDGIQTIDCVNYLNDLNFLCLTVSYESPMSDTYVGGEFCFSGDSSLQWSTKVKLVLLANTDGRLIREILVEEPWNNPCEEHRIELDLNFIIHTIKHSSNKFSCHVYSLQETDEAELKTTRKSKKQTTNQLPLRRTSLRLQTK